MGVKLSWVHGSATRVEALMPIGVSMGGSTGEGPWKLRGSRALFFPLPWVPNHLLFYTIKVNQFPSKGYSAYNLREFLLTEAPRQQNHITGTHHPRKLRLWSRKHNTEDRNRTENMWGCPQRGAPKSSMFRWSFDEINQTDIGVPP